MIYTIADKIADYAFKYWKRHKLTAWPTVREAAKALGYTQKTIEEYQGIEYELGQYHAKGQTLGDSVIEARTQAAEREWCEYWLPLSGHNCICGEHRLTHKT